MQISQGRLGDVKKEIAALMDKLKPLEMKHNKEKQRRDDISRLQKKKEELLEKLERAEMTQNLPMVADIK